MTDLFNYHRRVSSVVNVGNTPLGGENPIRIQSMTTTSTMDTEGSVNQAIRIIEAGGEYVRLTTQGVSEAENMKNINIGLRSKGYMTPLVADVHFNPHVADVAAQYAEKVRINPGNYVDPARTFRHLDYTDDEYQQELKKIEERFIPFLDICRTNHTAIRIGVNHGSLSDRIMSRYGDTPEGIVESCMEFLRICKRVDFNDVVISIKASNTVVMVRSVRLLVNEMDKEGMQYPLHLGVTEAGEGEDGHIKSAVGIGALLCDGIGDTIRVSLSEEPEAEIPVARHLVDYITRRADHLLIPGAEYQGFDYLHPERRKTRPVMNIGGENVPVVISTRLDKNNGSKTSTTAPDYIYCGRELPAQRDGQAYIVDADVYTGEKNTYPAFTYNVMALLSMVQAPLKFLFLPFGANSDEYLPCLKNHPEVVVVAQSNHQNRTGDIRALAHELMSEGISNPIVIFQHYNHSQEEKGDFQLEAAADMSALMMDGLCDGIMLFNQGTLSLADIDATAFGILQAARLRTSKTEYISCPGCGRTLYDLRDTIRRIKEATADLDGLKIGIMGCIVNGPGEMADADYGYVGAGRGKISLYRRKECIQKNIPESEAVERLLDLIHQDMTNL